MKNKINFLSSILFSIFIFTISCSEKSEIIEDTSLPQPVTLTPSIKSLSPEKGTGGIEISIIGENFGNNIKEVNVSFGSKKAEVTLYSRQRIKVKVPSGESNITINVTVSVGDKVSNKKEFSYILAPPSITSLSTTCFYNSTVMINGNNFSEKKEDNIVKFGMTVVKVTKATNTTLHVIAPDLGDATTAEVTVTGVDGTSNAKSIAVDIDQDKIVKYDWTTHTVKPGIIYKKGQFSLFGKAQRRVYVLDITLDASNKLGIGFSTNNVSTTEMCKDYNGVAGVNAGYFPFGGPSDKDPYIRINGKSVQMGQLGALQLFTNSAFIINKNVATVKKFTESHNNLNQVAAAIPVAEAENIIVCGPMLITSDIIENVNMNEGHNNSQVGRTGLGVTADGKRVFMVVVDTGGGFTGMTTPQLAKILQALGSVNAMNLDGGGSSTMFVKDQGDNGRVSFPNGGTWERPIRSVIYVK